MDTYGMSDMDERSASNDTPMSEDGSPAGHDTVMIPRELLGGRECKPGEKLTLTVTSVSPDGVEASVDGYGEQDGAGQTGGGYEDAGPAIDRMAGGGM